MKNFLSACACLCVLGTAAAAQNLSYEIYGGVVPEDTDGLEYDGTVFPMDQGQAFGLGVYLEPMAGFEVGLDVMSTDRRYTGFPSGIETLSFMLNARYPFAVSDSFTAYAGLGLGAINVEYDGSTEFPAFSGDETTSGGQISLGGRYGLPVGEIFAEIRYQAAFDKVDIVDPDIEYNSTAFLVGYRF